MPASACEYWQAFNAACCHQSCHPLLARHHRDSSIERAHPCPQIFCFSEAWQGTSKGYCSISTQLQVHLQVADFFDSSTVRGAKASAADLMRKPALLSIEGRTHGSQACCLSQ